MYLSSDTSYKKVMNRRKVKRILALALSIVCVGSGFGGFSVNASQISSDTNAVQQTSSADVSDSAQTENNVQTDAAGNDTQTDAAGNSTQTDAAGNSTQADAAGNSTQTDAAGNGVQNAAGNGAQTDAAGNGMQTDTADDTNDANHASSDDVSDTGAATSDDSAEADTDDDNDGSADTGKVTFGVVSDTHVTASKTTEQNRLAQAFQYFSSLNLDRMVVVGDLTDSGSTSEYNTWKSIKDEYLTIPLIASMGNHEGNSASGFVATTGNKPNNNQVVNGYHFITLSPGAGTLDEETGCGSSQGGGNYTYTLEWLKEQLDAAVAEDPTKPIFVFFHHPIKNTFYVSNEWYGYGLEEIFKDYPQVVTFSGHIHSPNNNPTSIWQDGGYTAVNTVTLSYMELETGMIYGSIPPNASNIAQGLEVSVEGSVVTIKNYDFIAGEYLDQTWTFDVTKELPYTSEREASAVKPEFAQTDEIRLSNITDESAVIEFDQATVPENTVGDIVHSYRYDFIDTKTGTVTKTFKTFSEYYFTPMPETITQTATDLAAGTEYELRIYAIDAYGLVSDDYLTITFKTTGENDNELTVEDMASGIPTADMLDVDFSDGVITDHSEWNHTFSGSDGSNIVYNEELGKYTAAFTGQDSECFMTDWTIGQYAEIVDSFTMEMVLNVDEIVDSYVNPFANMQQAGMGFEIYPNDDDASMADVTAWIHIGGYKIPRANASIELGTWNHLAVTYDGTKVTLYINGEKVSSVAASGNVTIPANGYQYFVIGADSAGDGDVEAVTSGGISTARIYSGALTAKQIRMLANRDLSSLDTEKPIISVNGEIKDVYKVGEACIVPAATAVDNSTSVTLKAEIFDAQGQLLYAVGGDSASVEETIVTPETAGDYTVIYTAVDGAGNTETLEVNVTVSEAEVPDTETPDTETPDTETPDTEVPDTETPDTEVPDTEVPDIETPDTEVPGTETPDTEVPGTETPDTEVPDTKAPDKDNVSDTVDTDKGTAGKSDQPTKPSGNSGSIDSVKTGDETNLWVPVIAMIASLGGIAAAGTIVYKRRKM